MSDGTNRFGRARLTVLQRLTGALSSARVVKNRGDTRACEPSPPRTYEQRVSLTLGIAEMGQAPWSACRATARPVPPGAQQFSRHTLGA